MLFSSLDERIKFLKEKLSPIYLPHEIEEIIEKVKEIDALKKEKNVVALGHNYMVPEVYYGVSDFVGDSLGLAKKAKETSCDIILFDGVYFMAETAKILNPQKKVLIPDKEAGCSLADSISKEDILALKEEYPGVPIVAYINTPAEVKAYVDIICTSSNAEKVVESLEKDTVIFVPDAYLAQNVARNTSKKIIPWKGKCVVHELFTEYDVSLARKNYPGITVLAHPECKEEVCKKADYVGSTSQMIRYVKEKKPERVMLLTECSMSDIYLPNLSLYAEDYSR